MIVWGTDRRCNVTDSFRARCVHVLPLDDWHASRYCGEVARHRHPALNRGQFYVYVCEAHRDFAGMDPDELQGPQDWWLTEEQPAFTRRGAPPAGLPGWPPVRRAPRRWWDLIRHPRW